MVWYNKIVWTEGMFMRPQHFQQHDRYLENYIEGRVAGTRCFNWGLAELDLDEGLLNLGKVAIASCRGVLPDGTPINIPRDDPPPAPLEVPPEAKDVTVYLALPHRRSGAVEANAEGDGESMARYQVADVEVRDTSSDIGEQAPVQIGNLCLRLMAETQELADHTLLGVARVTERQADNRILLDKDYIPPCLDCQANVKLRGFLEEVAGLLHHRGEALAGRVSASGRGGAAEIAEFLLLQTVNRFEPLFLHMSVTRGLHPEDFYRDVIQAAGELATFAAADKRPQRFPIYRHDALQETFMPVIEQLREALSMVIEQSAVSIPLKERKYGIRLATIGDKSLLDSASFVLAVSAQVADEKIRSHIPQQMKIGPPEHIRQLVNAQLPGIALRPMAAAPRQIPYHAGFTYFELDRSSEYWAKLESSFAMHCSGEYPGLELEFWAIRG